MPANKSKTEKRRKADFSGSGQKSGTKKSDGRQPCAGQKSSSGSQKSG